MLAGRQISTMIARVAGLALLGAAWSAQAFTIDSSTSVGDSFTVTWELLAGATDPNGNLNNTGYDLTGSADFVVTSIGETTVSFDVTLTNTTDPNTAEIGLQKFGFATSPDATLVSWSNVGADGKITDVANYSNSDSDLDNAVAPGGVSVIDIVASTDTGTNGTLQSGEQDTVNIVVGFNDPIVDGVEFSPFAVKYQSDPDSFEFPGQDDNGGGGPPTGDVPLPGTLVLLGAGLMAMRRFNRGG